MTAMEIIKQENTDDDVPVPVTSSSAIPNNTTSAIVSPTKPSGDACSPQLLHMYYSRLFPLELLYQWLSYGNHGQHNNIFGRREFSFTIESPTRDEIYIRYQSFATADQLAREIVRRCPKKIDLGAVFSHPPKQKDSIGGSQFKPQLRELVFDVDLTDYDAVRHCGCQGARICPTCWDYMKMAVRVMDDSLRNDFGFAHIAWIYSGRRGVHAWVCDPEALALTDEARNAIASYYEVQLGSENNAQVELTYPLHPMLARAYELLEPLFVQRVVPALLSTPDTCHAMLDALPDKAAAVRDKFLPYWTTSKCAETTPAQKWADLKEHLASFVEQRRAGQAKAAKVWTTAERNRLEHWPVEVVFRHGYPRLDVNVSKMRNHLLKAPFCVHPKTGRVCVPMGSDVEAFDPFAVPTLLELEVELQQTNSHNKATTTDDERQQKPMQNGWKGTSLEAYFAPFRKDFLEPLLADCRRQAKDETERVSAIRGDF